MKELPFLNPAPVFLELTPRSLRAVREGNGVELPLEFENGRLTAASREKIVSRMQEFLNRKSWQPRIRAWCAISAGGLVLRRLALPTVSDEEFQRLLLLQVEAEFPLTPEELAWGWRRISAIGSGGTSGRQEVLVAAIKKTSLEGYAGLLADCGLRPIFTPAVLARAGLCPLVPIAGGLLDLERRTSELLLFEHSVPSGMRVLPWGADDLAKSDAMVDAFAKAAGAPLVGKTLYVTGGGTQGGEIAAILRRRMNSVAGCQWLETPAGEGRSAAIAGLRKSIEDHAGPPPLALEIKHRPVGNVFRWSDLAHQKLLKVAACLAAALLVLPYAEALVVKPFLVRKLAATKTESARLAVIDREMDFLQYLKQNQPPYLDALYLFAKSAPPGARIESLSMNQKGDVSLRATMQDSSQVTDFRSKLIDSGFFAAVTVEEQAPVPNQQKLGIRMTAQWKPPGTRALIAPTADEIAKAKAPKENAGGPSPGSLPPGMPPGQMPPGPMPRPIINH